MSDSTIISGLQHTQRAIEHWEVFAGTCQGRGRELILGYVKKLKWIQSDLRSTPAFPQEVRDALREEIKADVFEIDDIYDKIPLIPADQRQMVLEVINLILSGEKIKIMDDER